MSPVFGMPNKEVGGEIVNELQSFIDFSKETGDLLDNSQWIQQVFVSLENTEQNLLDLEVELKTMPYAEMTGLGFEDNLFPEYSNANRYLREAGQKLKEFAYKTVAVVRELKTLFAAVDESQDQDESQELFHLPIDHMTGFMSETLEKLREANEKYKTAKNTFVDLKNVSTGSKDKVVKMLIEYSVEQEEWKKVVRDAVRRENNIPELAKKLKMEIMARWGGILEKAEPKDRANIRAAIGAEGNASIDRQIQAQIESKVEPDIEFATQSYNAKLDKLKGLTDSMLESGASFEETIDNAMNILNEKIAKIAMSTKSANVLSENKDKYPQEFLTKYQQIRTDLIQGLDDLKNSAEYFLTVPDITELEEEEKMLIMLRGQNSRGDVKEKMLRMLDMMLTEDSSLHRAWVANVRAVVREELVRKFKDEIEAHYKSIYESVTDPMIRANIKATLEAEKDASIERAVAPIEAKIEPDIEAAINKYSTKLEKLKTMTERMIKSGNNFDKAILADEILQIAMSNESGHVISRNIDTYSQVFLREYQDIKTDFINELDDITRKAQRNYVAKFSLEAERKILEVEARLKSMHQEFEFEENYYPAYNRAKSYLRETRQNLRDLAISTRNKARDLKIVLEDLNKSDDSVLFKIYTNRMNDPRIDPVQVLTEADEKYNSALLTFENANSYITIIGLEKNSLDEMSESGKQFNKIIKVLTDILKEEIDQIRTWNKCLKVVRRNLESYSEDTLRELDVARTIFINGLDELTDATETFLAQPRDIIKLA